MECSPEDREETDGEQETCAPGMLREAPPSKAGPASEEGTRPGGQLQEAFLFYPTTGVAHTLVTESRQDLRPSDASSLQPSDAGVSAYLPQDLGLSSLLEATQLINGHTGV